MDDENKLGGLWQKAMLGNEDMAYPYTVYDILMPGAVCQPST